MSATTPRTMFEKIWDAHVVHREPDGTCLLYVDRHFIHEGSRLPFQVLRSRGLAVRRPDLTFATPDHYVPTTGRTLAEVMGDDRRAMVAELRANTTAAGIVEFGMEDQRHGIVHVMGPEQGLSLPGMLILCGDSHTSTHGAVGALAFGIGASEVAHVLATQTLWQRQPRRMRVHVAGRLGPGVSAKDLALALIARIGVNGGTGHVIEYAGPVVEALSVEGRLTLCNLSIEAGARAGMVAPDARTFEWLRGRPHAPSGAAWDAAVARWRALRTDEGARFDREVTFEASAVEPMVTWGNRPSDAVPISGAVPPPAEDQQEAALDYMGLTPGTPLREIRVDEVFIGSCTNGRIEDLRAAAAVLRGRRVAPGVRAIVVPGSGLVRRQAEEEGLAAVFAEAGFEWRHSGCSMCLAVNGDGLERGRRSASTTNRNFVGRQGPGGRTHLVSPATAAATAVMGHFADPRPMLAEGR